MKLLLIFLLHLIMILFIGGAPPAAAQYDVWASKCYDSHDYFTANSSYKSNLDSLLTKLTTNDIPYGFKYLTAGADPDQVYLLAQCRGDINATDCRACLSSVKSNITATCPTHKLVLVWAEKCFLYYSDDNMYAYWDNAPLKTLGTEVSVGGNVDHFSDVVEALLMRLPNKTAGGDNRLKFATGEANVNASLTVYALMQCTPDLVASNCLACVYWNMYYVLYTDVRGQTGAQAVTPSCSIKYDINKFYEGPSTKLGNGVNPRIVIISALSVFLFVLLTLFGILIWLFVTQRHKDKMRKKAIGFKSLQMDFHIIKRATKNFSKQLGSSGNSRVYKGKLDGSQIAVKRITDTSSDGNDFENWLLTTSKLQHSNLADILGFCVQGHERLIIFEYVSKGSLDQILFDPKYAKERSELDWKKRYDIIRGIAQGLLYLHDKYRYKILHGDLKAANVLLDEDWAPRITDIGTAKLFQQSKNQTHGVTQGEARVLIPGSETQEITRGKGTTAYMSPEYLNDGIITEKSDVYSFGVLVLEILAGRRRSDSHAQEDLITLARRTFERGTVSEFIDPKIKPATESAKGCIQIALSCLHENAKERAEMSSVVEMLTTNLEQPSTPESIQFSSPQPLLPNRLTSSSL